MTQHQHKLFKLRSLLEERSLKKDRRIIVDFDHTLFLSNSTEEFLNTVRPAFLAALILKALALLRPWKILPQDRAEFAWRDAIRVWTILVLMPWSWLAFRAQARSIFDSQKNKELVGLLRGLDAKRIVIVSFGFSFVIRSLLKGSPFDAAELIASSLRQPTDLRMKGKAASLLNHAGGFDVDRDLVITDSDTDDGDLLDMFRHAFHIRWPNDVARGAHESTYVPFFYLIKVKRSPEFFFKQVLLEELPILLLAFVIFQPSHWSVVILGLTVFLTIQMVHEIGYLENDRIGYVYEINPKLSEEFERYKRFQIEPPVWFWVAGLTAFAVAMLEPEYVAATIVRLGMEAGFSIDMQRLMLFSIWMALLGIVRAAFYLFNHVPLAWRIFAYFPLHVVKYFSPWVLFASAPAGLALLCAHVIRTWSVYAIRRCGGDIEIIASQLIRLMFVVFILVIAALSMPESALFTQWQTWLIVVWCMVRAVPEIRKKLLANDVMQGFVPLLTERQLLRELDYVDEKRREDVFGKDP